MNRELMDLYDSFEPVPKPGERGTSGMSEREQVAEWVNEAREAGSEWMRIRTDIVANLLKQEDGAGMNEPL